MAYIFAWELLRYIPKKTNEPPFKNLRKIYNIKEFLYGALSLGTAQVAISVYTQ